MGTKRIYIFNGIRAHPRLPGLFWKRRGEPASEGFTSMDLLVKDLQEKGGVFLPMRFSPENDIEWDTEGKPIMASSLSLQDQIDLWKLLMGEKGE